MEQRQPLDQFEETRSVLAGRIGELLRSISAALRNYRLYGGEGGAVERFISAAASRAHGVWETEHELPLDIDENSVSWEGQVVYAGTGETSDLSFVLHKDGVRRLVFLPGFEEELLGFISVIARASQVRSDADDLVTLLWEADLERVRYETVELTVSATEGRGHGDRDAAPSIDPADVRANAGSPAQPGLTTDDFEDTLYFLDDAEMRRLQEEIRLEMERDLWGDVLDALFDLLEDGDEARQTRIIGTLTEILPSMLAAGRVDRAAKMISEVVEIATRHDALGADALLAVRALVERLGSAEAINQLVVTIEDAPEALQGEHLGELLRFFPASSLPELMRASEGLDRAEIRVPFEDAIQRLAAVNRDVVVEMLDAEDPRLARNAARWAARLGAEEGVPTLIRMLRADDIPGRIAAIHALQELRADSAGQELMRLIEDDTREVRLAAVQALAALKHAPARKPLEDFLGSKRARTFERTEKVALFEAYARLAETEGIAFLDRTLNGRRFLGKTEPSEHRASAALALGIVREPAARAALAAAADDDDPVVRSAVSRALRGSAA